MVAEIQPEMQRHFERWAAEMHPKLNMEAPRNPIGAYNYWLARTERAHNVFNRRPHVFWGMVQDHFGLSDAQMLDYFGPRPELPEI